MLSEQAHIALAEFRLTMKIAQGRRKTEIQIFSAQEMLDLVTFVTGLEPAELGRPDRRFDIVKARQIFWWLCDRFTRYPLPTVALRLPGPPRDHSTLLHGIGIIRKLADQVGRPEKDTPVLWCQRLWDQVLLAREEAHERHAHRTQIERATTLNEQTLQALHEEHQAAGRAERQVPPVEV